MKRFSYKKTDKIGQILSVFLRLSIFYENTKRGITNLISGKNQISEIDVISDLIHIWLYTHLNKKSILVNKKSKQTKFAHDA